MYELYVFVLLLLVVVVLLFTHGDNEASPPLFPIPRWVDNPPSQLLGFISSISNLFFVPRGWLFSFPFRLSYLGVVYIVNCNQSSLLPHIGQLARTLPILDSRNSSEWQVRWSWSKQSAWRETPALVLRRPRRRLQSSKMTRRRKKKKTTKRMVSSLTRTTAGCGQPQEKPGDFSVNGMTTMNDFLMAAYQTKVSLSSDFHSLITFSDFLFAYFVNFFLLFCL